MLLLYDVTHLEQQDFPSFAVLFWQPHAKVAPQFAHFISVGFNELTSFTI
jgi:hypothetical protein